MFVLLYLAHSYSTTFDSELVFQSGQGYHLFMEIQMKKKKKIEKVFETKEQREQRYADNIKKARSFARQCGIKVR